jgi:acetyl-CoA acyltransferase
MPQQSQAREVVIVEAVRTPIGRGHQEKGIYRDIHPVELLGTCLAEVVERAGIDASAVDNVIGGCVQQFGPQGLHIARNAWLHKGLPIETSATTIDLQCGSAQQAVGFGTALIASGIHDVVIGSGVEHMGRVPFRGRGSPGAVRAALHRGAARPPPDRRPGARSRDDRREVGRVPRGA